jgi:hypothetical protein
MISVESRSTIVQCGRDGAGQTICFSRGGRQGCDAWEREPGIDDDDWDAVGIPRINPNARPEQPLAQRARSRGTDGWWTEPPRPRRPPAPQPIPIQVVTRDPFGGIFDWDEDA